MSTRAQIRLIDTGKHIDIYHHYDGYPSGVGAELKDILSFEKSSADEFFYKLVSKYEGYEHTDAFHGDIDWFYRIDFTTKKFIAYECCYPPWESCTSFDELCIVPDYEKKIDMGW